MCIDLPSLETTILGQYAIFGNENDTSCSFIMQNLYHIR